VQHIFAFLAAAKPPDSFITECCVNFFAETLSRPVLAFSHLLIRNILTPHYFKVMNHDCTTTIPFIFTPKMNSEKALTVAGPLLQS
jgi:hypothetical protein